MKKLFIFIILFIIPNFAYSNFLIGNQTQEATTGTMPYLNQRSAIFQAIESGTVTGVAVYVASAAGVALVAGIYADSGTNTPTSLLAQTTAWNTVTGWNYLTITACTITTGVNYHLSFFVSGSSTDRYVYTTSDAPAYQMANCSSSGFPTMRSTFGTIDTYYARKPSIYAYGTTEVPTPTPTPTGWSFCVIGDLHFGDSDKQTEIFQSIQANSPNRSFIVSVGDNVSGGYAANWDDLTTTANTYLTGGIQQSPFPPKFVSCPGNHEFESSSGLARWNTWLSWQATQNNGKYFVMDNQNARFIFLDAFGDTTGAQASFLQQQCSSNTKTWLFVVFHTPVFEFYGDYGEALNNAWGDIIRQYRVDAVFNGHHHMYLRTKKIIFGGTVNPELDESQGTVEVISDNCNDTLHAVTENKNENQYALGYSYDESQAAFLGYTDISINGSTATLKHYHVNGTVMDQATYTANEKPKTGLIRKISGRWKTLFDWGLSR